MSLEHARMLMDVWVGTRQRDDSPAVRKGRPTALDGLTPAMGGPGGLPKETWSVEACVWMQHRVTKIRRRRDRREGLKGRGNGIIGRGVVIYSKATARDDARPLIEASCGRPLWDALRTAEI